jgi:phosphopantetheine adenylyltransferase
MTERHSEHVRHYRERAEELREMAQSRPDKDATLLALAENYGRLAETLESVARRAN